MEIPKNFFTADYLFSSAAPTNMTLFITIACAYFLFIILAVVLSFNKGLLRQFRTRLYNFFLTIGIVGVFISFFRYEKINYIGSRLAMLLLIICAAIWYLSITFYSVVKMPKEVRLQKNQERYQSYLPKKKRFSKR